MFSPIKFRRSVDQLRLSASQELPAQNVTCRNLMVPQLSPPNRQRDEYRFLRLPFLLYYVLRVKSNRFTKLKLLLLLLLTSELWTVLFDITTSRCELLTTHEKRRYRHAADVSRTDSCNTYTICRTWSCGKDIYP
jgi:hypothetical protein